MKQIKQKKQKKILMDFEIVEEEEEILEINKIYNEDCIVGMRKMISESVEVTIWESDWKQINKSISVLQKN